MQINSDINEGDFKKRLNFQLRFTSASREQTKKLLFLFCLWFIKLSCFWLIANVFPC